MERRRYFIQPAMVCGHDGEGCWGGLCNLYPCSSIRKRRKPSCSPEKLETQKEEQPVIEKVWYEVNGKTGNPIQQTTSPGF